MATATKVALFLASLLSGLPSPAFTPEVCVLAPYLEPGSTGLQGAPMAKVPVSRPTLFVREPLSELRIERGPTLLWTWRSQMGEALEGPLAWPLPPLKPGQALTLRLRPLEMAPGHFATIQLQGDSRERLRQGDGLLQSVMGHPQAWRPAIDTLLNRGDRALATALLFANEGPNSPGLRLLVAQQSCP